MFFLQRADLALNPRVHTSNICEFVFLLLFRHFSFSDFAHLSISVNCHLEQTRNHLFDLVHLLAAGEQLDALVGGDLTIHHFDAAIKVQIQIVLVFGDGFPFTLQS